MSRKIQLLISLLFLVSSDAAMACAVCMGANDSPIAPAVNAAIFFMLGCIGCMLAGVAAFAFYLFKRKASPNHEMAEMIESLKESIK
jgi:hypothetical protein